MTDFIAGLIADLPGRATRRGRPKPGPAAGGCDAAGARQVCMTCDSRLHRPAPVTCTHPGSMPRTGRFPMHPARLAPALLLVACLPAAAGAVEIDGRIDPGEWAGAHHVTDFRQVQPLSGAPASLPTEAWILATPEGLAVAFRNVQPPSVPRTGQRVQRDFEAQVDRVNLMVDFDGGGRTGYNFTVSSTNGVYDAVVTNESQFNKDWDGNWKHATGGDARGWTAEILVPWYIAPMREGSDGRRTLGVYVDRVVGSTGERAAWPAVSYVQSRFLSEFEPLQVPVYNQSLLAITPYASGLYDNVGGGSDFD